MRRMDVLAATLLLVGSGAARAETFDVTAEAASCSVYRQAAQGTSAPALVGVRHFIGAPGVTLLVAVPPAAAIPMATTRAALSTAAATIGPVEVARTAAGAQVFLVPVEPRAGPVETLGRAALTGVSASPVEIDFAAAARMVRAAAGCERGLLTGWGFAPDAPLSVATPPPLDRARWPGIDDVPERHLDIVNGRFTTLAWRVGTDGRIADCRVVEPSGEARLDALGCPALRRRITYRAAARDAVGRPVEAVMVRRIRWGPIE